MLLGVEIKSLQSKLSMYLLTVLIIKLLETVGCNIWEHLTNAASKNTQAIAWLR